MALAAPALVCAFAVVAISAPAAIAAPTSPVVFKNSLRSWSMSLSLRAPVLASASGASLTQIAGVLHLHGDCFPRAAGINLPEGCGDGVPETRIMREVGPEHFRNGD